MLLGFSFFSFILQNLERSWV